MESPAVTSGASTPRFTEDFNASPPCQHFQNLILGHNPQDGPNSERNRSHQSHHRHFSNDSTAAPAYNSDSAPRGGLHHRLSDKERAFSPSELASPLPEALRHDHEEKEVVISSDLPEVYGPHEADSPQKRKVCGLSKKAFTLLLGLAVLLAIALGVGLGVGLGTKQSGSPSPRGKVDTAYLIGGSLDPKYYSTLGAYNGSGIAVAQQSFTQDLATGTQGTVVLYFQHCTGQIRWQQLSNSGVWLGGDETTIVATNAKNGTPLSAVSYASKGVSTWHVFYVDDNNTISQKTNSNATNLWVDGPITAMQLTVMDADEVGMQACWYGNDYGDSDYTHSPIPGQAASSSSNSEVGMHLWYASDNSTFQQYGWRSGDDTWTFQEEWSDKNGHAGVACYSWGPGSVTYAMFVNLESTVEFWWKDTNTNLTNTTVHPINTWVNTSIAINNVHPSSALGFTNYFYAQMSDSLKFNGYNISWAAENTTISDDGQFTVGSTPGVPGTHLSVTTIPNHSGGDQILVFYQTNGSDISEYTRDLVAGQWGGVTLPIPAQ